MKHLSALPDIAQIIIGTALGIIAALALVSGVFAIICATSNSDYDQQP